MPARSALLQSTLLIGLAAVALPSLLISEPPRSGPLGRDGLLLTLTVLEVAWLSFLLPFGVSRKTGMSPRQVSAHLGALASGGVVLALPILILAGRLGGGSTSFLIGSQALAAAVAAVAIPCLSSTRAGRDISFLGAAILITLLPPFVSLAAGDLLGKSPDGLLAALSPLFALARAYPDRGPWEAVAIFGGAAGILWLVRQGRLREAGVVGIAAICALSLTGLSHAAAPGGMADRPGSRSTAAEDGPELLGISSPLGGRFRPGGWAAATVTFRNTREAPLEGNLILRVGGVEYPRALRIPGNETVAVDFVLLLPDERPAPRAIFRTPEADVSLPKVEEGLLHLFRSLQPSEPLIGWAGGSPVLKILEGISAAQVTLPESVGPRWEALDPVDLVVVTGRLGGRMTRTIRDWQLHGGVVLSLSEEASVDLGAPLPGPGEEMAVRRRGKGLLGTMDLEGAEDRGVLFQKARDLLRSGSSRRSRPGSSVADLFGAPRHGASALRRVAAWLLGFAALGVALSGLLFRRLRLPAQGALAAAAIATLPWVVPSPVVVERITVLSGSAGSTALVREDLIRVATLGPREGIRIQGIPGSLPVPMGALAGLSLSADGTWTALVSPGSERIFLLPGEETLGGVVEMRVSPEGEMKIGNRTDLPLEEAGIIRFGRYHPTGGFAPGETRVASLQGDGLALPRDLRTILQNPPEILFAARVRLPLTPPPDPAAAPPPPPPAHQIN